ncbi:MAG: DNA mismatch repair protein MutS, partial [Syntrophomonadaceae bacterium]|nr:DNA mismatch repair protein MutS [Syntrophomonadaceae bacterium]
MSKSTPMMQQYREIKAQYPDAILFFRLGDFYEMFFDDAVTAARALDIVLTARDGGPDGRVPMCGVPCHSADTYIARLIERGYRVAICEQVEDPAGARGLVRREVVRVVTPGTVLDPAMLDEGRNNYLVALVETEERAALAAVDVSTGEFLVTEVSGQDWRSQAMSELYRLQPVEALVPARTGQESLLYEYAERAPGLAITEVDPGSYELARAQRAICDYFAVDGLEAFGLQDAPLATIAAGAVTAFLNETQKGALSHIRGIVRYSAQDVLGMDMSTRRSLELTRTARDGTREGSLLWV